MTHPRLRHRGLTLVELMISLAITTMIGVAIATMMATVSQGVGTRRDTRSLALRAHSAHVRLSACIDSSRAVVMAGETMMVLWHDDSRSGGTIHASELRWIEFSPDDDTLLIHQVSFPSEWSQTDCDKKDRQLSSQADFEMVLDEYAGEGWIATATAADGVAAATFWFDDVDPLEARLVRIDLEFEHDDSTRAVQSTHSLRFHQEPSS